MRLYALGLTIALGATACYRDHYPDDHARLERDRHEGREQPAYGGSGPADRTYQAPVYDAPPRHWEYTGHPDPNTPADWR